MTAPRLSIPTGLRRSVLRRHPGHRPPIGRSDSTSAQATKVSLQFAGRQTALRGESGASRCAVLSFMSILILLAAVTCTGCFTLMGTGLGSLMDSGGENTRTQATSAEVLPDLEIGSKMNLMMRDSSQHFGIFRGLTNPEPDSTLAEARRRNFGACSGRAELRVGDSITAILNNGRPLAGLHLGSFRNGMRIRQAVNGTVTFLPFADLASIQWCEGTRTLRPPFDAPFKQGMLDFVQSVNLTSTEGPRVLPMRDIMSVHRTIKPAKSGWLIGLVIGLSADIALLLSLSSAK